MILLGCYARFILVFYYSVVVVIVPQAIEAFLESTDFEDAIRTAISVGGDSDTLAAITGSIAGVYYGIPQHIARMVFDKLDPRLQGILNEFERAWVL